MPAARIKTSLNTMKFAAPSISKSLLLISDSKKAKKSGIANGTMIIAPNVSNKIY